MQIFPLTHVVIVMVVTDAAVRNADNVGYFAKYQPGSFSNGPAGYDQNCKDRYTNCAQLCSSYKGSCCKSCGGTPLTGLLPRMCCASHTEIATAREGPRVLDGVSVAMLCSV